ncbi:MAG TPA: hemerythrin domain-containing protein [Candidatus Acidoferrales bacterium]|nr:hemerythrin domain-containing protein [Candidatus Acidoferrales bacterium]
MTEHSKSRRQVIRWIGVVSGGAIFADRGCLRAENRPKEQVNAKGIAEEVSPNEDLMRDHGLLNRLLLIYEEAARRLDVGADLDPAALSRAAGVIRHFIEDYHEKLEEDHMFPRFERAGKLVELVAVLRTQHQAGRRLTTEIQRLANLKTLKKPSERRTLGNFLRMFSGMYRPHEAWEDTVLFPAFRGVVSGHEYAALGEEFEDQEHKLFGEDGFEKNVAQVAALEKEFGIYDLERFTPRWLRFTPAS